MLPKSIDLTDCSDSECSKMFDVGTMLRIFLALCGESGIWPTEK